jgi:very-short-patch-repair endonuclease
MKAYNKDLVSNAQALRKNMTPEEKHLWYDLLRRLPMKAHRQYNIGNYIVDFYIPQKRLVIEIDGIQHLAEEHKEKDQIRDKFLEGQGLWVLRFPNESIRKNFADVCQVILSHIEVKFEDLKES